MGREIENTTENKKSAKARAKKKKDAMKKRHEEEKAKFLFSEEDEITLEVLNLTVEEPVKAVVEEKEETEPKVSKTAKRRAKKAQQEREKQDRIKAALAESEARFLAGERSPKQLELEKIQKSVSAQNLKIHEIRSDGDCLYSSIS